MKQILVTKEVIKNLKIVQGYYIFGFYGVIEFWDRNKLTCSKPTWSSSDISGNILALNFSSENQILYTGERENKIWAYPVDIKLSLNRKPYLIGTLASPSATQGIYLSKDSKFLIATSALDAIVFDIQNKDAIDFRKTSDTKIVNAGFIDNEYYTLTNHRQAFIYKIGNENPEQVINLGINSNVSKSSFSSRFKADSRSEKSLLVTCRDKINPPGQNLILETITPKYKLVFSKEIGSDKIIDLHANEHCTKFAVLTDTQIMVFNEQATLIESIKIDSSLKLDKISMHKNTILAANGHEVFMHLCN